MQFDIVMVIALVVAVVVFLQLRNVLGKRTGFERPPFDPYSTKPQKQAEDEAAADNVIALPKRDSKGNEDFSDINAIAEEGSELNKGLRDIRKADASFAPQSFMDGVRVAYEMIMTAFAKGDRNTLKPLLASDVYDDFSQAITDREKTGENVNFTFIGVDKADILSAEVQSGEALLTIRLASEVISATYDEKGQLVDGDPEAIAEIKDVWTFARNIRSKDPNWKLVGTQEDE